MERSQQADQFAAAAFFLVLHVAIIVPMMELLVEKILQERFLARTNQHNLEEVDRNSELSSTVTKTTDDAH
jgi:p-aminobenzoyl-glutamate transporter AbgT